jgi:putative hydrolase of the HAD superfamily
VAGIRLLTLDFWQTLFAEAPAALAGNHALRLARVREALAGAGHAFSAEAVAAGDARALVRFEAVWRQDRSMSPAAQIAMFLEALDPALPAVLDPSARAAVTRAYEEAILAEPPVLAPGAAEAVAAVAGEGIVLGLISNTGRTPGRVLRLLLERADLLPAFAVLSFSDETGTRKPDREIFQRTLAAAGIEAEAAAHVGDDATTDVAGARGAGMRAIHYVPRGDAAAGAHAALRDFRDLLAVLRRLG